MAAIPITAIKIGKNHKLDKDRVLALAKRIKEAGAIMEPVLVHEIDENIYCLIDGFYRFEAAKLLGHQYIPGIIAEDL